MTFKEEEVLAIPAQSAPQLPRSIWLAARSLARRVCVAVQSALHACAPGLRAAMRVGAFCALLLACVAQDAQADARPPQAVTALWSNPQHLDLFITDTHGDVASTWWEPNCGWQPLFVIDAGVVVAVPSQRVAAVWAANNTHLDLFVTGRDGQVMSTWWEGGKGWQKWFAIGPARNAASGQTVTAQWSNPNHLDLFITGADGTVKSTFWEANPPPPLRKGWQDWFAIGPARNAMAGQAVTAQWSNPNHLDLFITGADGTVKSTFWEANPPPPLRATCRTSLSLSGDRSAA
jgi:hypothetical protein